MSKCADAFKTTRVINNLLKVNYRSQRGDCLLHLRRFFSLARGQKRPKSKLMTQEIIKLSNALSWFIQGCRALNNKEEEREIWGGAYGSIHSRTLKLCTSRSVEDPHIFLFSGNMPLHHPLLKKQQRCGLASLAWLCKC